MPPKKLENEKVHKRYSPLEPDKELSLVTRSVNVDKPGKYRTSDRTKKDDLPSENIMKALSQMQSANHRDYQSVIELLPELVRGMSILESAVLSPKDLLNPILMYRMREDLVSDATSDVLSLLQTYLTTNYSLSERLPVLLREALHSKGAYVLGVLPRNTIDELVEEGKERVTMQSAGTFSGEHTLSTPLGLLGIPKTPGDTVNMQSYDSFLPTQINESLFNIAAIKGLTITDNYNTLKLPKVAANVRRSSIVSAVRPNVGIKRKLGDVVNMQSVNQDALSQLFKRRDYEKAEKLVLQTPSGSETVYGRPLEINFPMEATIPVHVGGDVTSKVGIIVLTDESGAPITTESVESQYRVLQSNLRKDDENSMSVTLERVREAMGGGGRVNVNSKQTATDLSTSFNNMVVTDLVERLKSGVYGSEVGISSADTVLNLAFKRLLCDRKTRMVFIPEEISTYIAFDYDEFGIGRSRLESSKIIASMRAILLYSNMNAAMTNATPNLKLDITLDEDDPDPEGTVDDTIAEFYALNSMRLKPGSTLNSHDITEMLQQMGVTIAVSGNKRYPEMNVALEDVGRNKATVDRDLDESLAKRIWLMMGLSPEAVDSSFDVEFARTIVSNNLFLAKLASEIQGKLLYQYTNHVRKLIYSDGTLMTSLIDVVGERLKIKDEEEVLEHVNELIEAFYLALPSTDIAKIETQQEALDNYTRFVETAIESYVNEEMLDGLVEGELYDGARPAIRAYRDMLIRDFMKRENILPELQAISSGDDNEIDLGGRFKEHVEPILTAMGGLLEHFRKKSRKFDQAEEDRIEKEEEAIQAIKDAEEAAAAAEEEASAEVEESLSDDVTEEDNSGEEEETDTGEEDSGETDDVTEEEDSGETEETDTETEAPAEEDDPLDSLDTLGL